MKILELLDQKIGDDELPQLKRLRENVAIDRIISTCCSFYGKTEDGLVKRGKGKRERQIAIYLSKVLSGKKNREVGNYFGLKASAISEIIKRVEVRAREEKNYRNEIDKIKRSIIEK